MRSFSIKRQTKEGKLKRKTTQSVVVAPWQQVCLECEKHPRIVTADGTQYLFCSQTCAKKHGKRNPVTVPAIPLIPPEPNACKTTPGVTRQGCGLYAQAFMGGFLFTHCDQYCAKRWPLQLVRCVSPGCQEYISGAYGPYCAVAHKQLHIPNNIYTPPLTRSGTLTRFNPFRVLGLSKDRILFYDKHDPFFEFTNFSPHSVVYNGKVYPTSEHLFQSLKFTNTRPDIAEYIRTVSDNPGVAFNEARKFGYAVRPDWHRVNIHMMELALYHKFTQHPFLTAKLLSTGDAQLIEDSPADEFWGVGRNRKGRNELGKALMRLRGKLE